MKINTSKRRNTMKFGTYVKEKRLDARMTLREFARAIAIDPSNWSKMERGITQPPANLEFLERISRTLGLNAEQRQELEDLAALARRELPGDLDDDALLAKVPAFFRALKGREYTPEDMDKLIEDIRRIHKH
jgi:transcriptional regulator with XRE-family HTH domain